MTLSPANAFNLDEAKILSSGKGLTLSHKIPTFNDPKEGGFENISGKGENAGNQHFLLFPKCFLPFPKQISIFLVTFNLSSVCALNLD